MNDKFTMTLEENMYLAKRNIVDSIWKSANLEGIAVTFPETDAVFNNVNVSSLKVNEIAALPKEICTGGSCVIDPYGHYETEPVWQQEAIIFADLDMNKVTASRMEFDATGHYSRPDVLELRVHE